MRAVNQARARPPRSLPTGLLASAAALVLMMGVSVPLSLDDTSGWPELKAAQAMGGGGGHGGGGGNGGGNGHGGGKGSSSALNGDGDEDGGYRGSAFGKLNAFNGGKNSAGNAAPYSTAGQLYAYIAAVEDGSIKDVNDAIEFLYAYANKDVDAEIVEAINWQLGLTFLTESTPPEDE